MTWHAALNLDYQRVAVPETGNQPAPASTRLHFRHEGPLRVLRSLYPEGPGICHNVLVHPPAGIAGGDEITIRVRAAAHTHAVLTTPGATRFYRTEGAPAHQKIEVALEANARLEWLPFENIAYSGCIAHNALSWHLHPQAECLGWDITALGLPDAQQPFVLGAFHQQVRLGDHWREAAAISAQDDVLLRSPLGLGGLPCMGTLYFFCGSALQELRAQQALEIARACIADSPLAARAGATQPQAQVLLVRALADHTEVITQLFRHIRGAWRGALWAMNDHRPRLWAL